MEMIFFIAMFLLVAYVTYRNAVMIARYRHNKEYIECYKELLAEADTAYDRICSYINNENEEEFKNKGRILKLYVQMDRPEDVSETLNSLDLSKIFTRNGKYSRQQVTTNTDVFVWLYMDMAKARRMSKFDVLDSLKEKFDGLSMMANRVEYQLFYAIYNALCEKEDAGVEMLSSMLDGNFAKYEYEKNLIGLFKRFASATLAYSGEPMEDYYKEDLHSFAATQIGKTYMRDLEILEKYPPRKEQEEETKQEEEPKGVSQEETKEGENDR
ncbi:MAG: hypothetical protein IJK53_01030 [Erysipelotrichaceae bacterium]|nr:hypothetical protein [Erysipelotrichaceae bacterium]